MYNQKWPFGTMRIFDYGLIVADPPWLFENRPKAGKRKNASAHYDCMPLDAIKALPAGHLAAKDCLLWLWAPDPMLPQALQVMAAWGFKFKTHGVWVKKKVKGKPAFGDGCLLRSAHELFLIGTVGEPKTSRSVRSAFEAKVREHGRKPDEAYEMAEALVPGDPRRADLFSRQDRPGWDIWGNEAEKFGAAA